MYLSGIGLEVRHAPCATLLPRRGRSRLAVLVLGAKFSVVSVNPANRGNSSSSSSSKGAEPAGHNLKAGKGAAAPTTSSGTQRSTQVSGCLSVCLFACGVQ